MVKPYVKFVPAEQDVVAEVAASAAEANTAAQGAATKIGNLSQLTTTAKSNLVAAINEAAQSGGSGAPVLKMTIETKSYDNIAFTGLAPSVMQRVVNFAVEGKTIQGVSLQNTTDAEDYIDATSDGEGGFVATIPGKTATYFVEAALSDNSTVSGVLFMVKITE